MKRICRFPRCKTILGGYNKEQFCCLHQRVITQNNLYYSKGKYYKDHLPTKREKKRHTHLPLNRAFLITLKGLVIELPDKPQEA